MIPAPPRADLPPGFAVELDPATRVRSDGRVLIGGAPLRMLTLSAPARTLLRDGRVDVADRTSAALARRLLDAGVAQPRPAGPPPDAAVTVVVPVRDRPVGLRDLLASLTGPAADPAIRSVLVVDDGSYGAAETRLIAGMYGATVRYHPTSRGPAAARNTGLAEVTTPYVAFLDSDCVPRPGWLPPLLAELSDPLVAAVAPRIVGPADADEGWLGRYEDAASSLDLGARESRVAPRSAVSYVPSAALLARRTALGAGFEESMPVAEDVDLVWRLVAAGWRVRYQPTAAVAHAHRTRLRPWLSRRAYYGTGAAPLAVRHGRAVAPFVADRWSAAAWGLALTAHPAGLLAAAGVLGVAGRRLAGRLAADVPALEHPGRIAAGLVVGGTAAGWTQVCAALWRHWWPVTAVAALASPRLRRVALIVGVADGLRAWLRTRPRLDPVRFVAARRLDDLAYGAGLWCGAARARTTAPLRPDLTRVSHRGGADRSAREEVSGGRPPRRGW